MLAPVWPDLQASRRGAVAVARAISMELMPIIATGALVFDCHFGANLTGSKRIKSPAAGSMAPFRLKIADWQDDLQRWAAIGCVSRALQFNLRMGIDCLAISRCNRGIQCGRPR